MKSQNTRIFLTLYLLLMPWIYVQAQDHSNPYKASFKSYQKGIANSEYLLEWESLGPVLNSARVESVQGHPNKPGTFYAAFGSGNLWKTIDNGVSWKPIFENQPSLGIGDIALAPSNPDVIYVGTGESLRKARNFTMPGAGVFRSEDGGSTWESRGLENSWQIGEVAVHPTDPDIVLVSVLGKFWSKTKSRGVYRTENGGKTWRQVLYINETTGANDVVFSPSDPSVVYATMWEFKADVRGDKVANNTGQNSGVHRSKDGGKTWERLSNGLPSSPETGRMSVAVSYSNPMKAYILVDNQAQPEMESGEVYRTIDGGENWLRTHAEPLRIFSVVGWYFTDIYVNPKNDNEIFGLGVRLANSVDGGRTFTYMEGDVIHLNPTAARGMHLDHCELWINPENPEHLILGNDGGVYTSYDHGKHWLHHNNIPSGEFYDITLTNESPYTIYGGVQDDATVFGPSIPYNSSYADPWQYLWIDPWNGGDGCVTQVDPENPDIVYFSAQEGAARRLDKSTQTTVSIRPRLPKDHEGDLKFNFITPYFISPHESKTLYHAGNYVFKSTDRGDHWSVISDDLTKSKDKKKASVAAGALVESPISPGILYFGSDNGVFWASLDDGKTWKEFSKTLPQAYIRSISPSRFKEGRVYVAMSGLNYDDHGAYLFVSEKNGKDWTSITSNLPSAPINVIAEDPGDENVLFAGTHWGVYVSFNRGEKWNYLGKNMPAASISDIEFDLPSGDMVVATHGRGIYKLNLNELRDLRNIDQGKSYLFPSPIAKRPWFNNTGRTPDQAYSTTLPITFWLNEPQTTRISILTSEDSVIFSTEIIGKKGLNQFKWDLIADKVKSDMPYFIHYSKYIEEGLYRVVLSTNETKLEQPVTIINANVPKPK